MKLFNNISIPSGLTSDVHPTFKRKTLVHTILETVKLVFLVAVTVFFLLEYVLPFAQTNLRINYSWRLFPLAKLSQDSSAKDILNLASMIRMITDNQFSESKVLRYAGLIYHASQKHEVNPLEIIALIMAESGFKENSINKETGDYGLGQINWGHWGKDYGYTPQQLLDPAINIFLTCHVYKFFGKDIGKYHRGYGIQSRAYIVNVKSILSTLYAFAELNKEDIS
jgi:hypothetical protein